jgi:hypothetical protein
MESISAMKRMAALALAVSGIQEPAPDPREDAERQLA